MKGISNVKWGKGYTTLTSLESAKALLYATTSNTDFLNHVETLFSHLPFANIAFTLTHKVRGYEVILM